MLFFVTVQPHDWITDSTFLAWISVASLIVGVVSILIGILVSYWFYRKGKDLKLLTYQIISDTPIMSIREQLGRGRIKTIYEDSNGHEKELDNASLLTLQVQNMGNVDVKIWNMEDTDIEDMEEPIKIEFEGRTVAGLTQVKTDPPEGVIQQKNLDAYLNILLQMVPILGLPRCLLKRRQSIQLSILLQGSGSKIKLEGKFFNGDILSIHDLENRKRSVQRTVLILLISGVIASLIGIILLNPSAIGFILASFSSTSSIVAILTVIGSLTQLARRERQSSK